MKKVQACRILFEGNLPFDFLKMMLDFSQELISQVHSSQIERFSYVCGGSVRNIGKDLKLTKLNLDKFEKDVSENGIKRLDFYKLSPNYVYKALDIDFSIAFAQEPRFSKIKSLVLHFEIFENTKSLNIKAQNLLKKLLNWLSSQKLKINYSCLLLMDKAKGPGFFINGVGNQGLTNYEGQVCQKWFLFKDKSDHKVIDIFWATVLNEQHIMGNFSQIEIERYFEEESFEDQKLYTLLLPMPLHEFNSEVFENDPYINKIRKLFKEKGILY